MMLLLGHLYWPKAPAQSWTPSSIGVLPAVLSSWASLSKSCPEPHIAAEMATAPVILWEPSHFSSSLDSSSCMLGFLLIAKQIRLFWVLPVGCCQAREGAHREPKDTCLLGISSQWMLGAGVWSHLHYLQLRQVQRDGAYSRALFVVRIEGLFPGPCSNPICLS